MKPCVVTLFVQNLNIQRLWKNENWLIIQHYQSPTIDIVIEKSYIIIKGKTDVSASVFINGSPIEYIQNGIFEQRVELLPGLNVIKISAKKRYSKEREVYRRIVVEKEK